MNKKELFERIEEGSPVCIGVPAGKKLVYVNLSTKDLKKSLKAFPWNTELPCQTVGRELPREQTRGWIVFFDVVRIQK